MRNERERRHDVPPRPKATLSLQTQLSVIGVIGDRDGTVASKLGGFRNSVCTTLQPSQIAIARELIIFGVPVLYRSITRGPRTPAEVPACA